METGKRWQDWESFVVAILLFITPCVLGIVTLGTHSLVAWMLGAVLSVVAIALAFLWLAFRNKQPFEGITVIVGLALVITPLVFSSSQLMVSAWVAIIVGLALTFIVTWTRIQNWSRQKTSARPVYRMPSVPETPLSFRQVSQSL